MQFFGALVPFLCLDRHGRNRASFEAPKTNRLAGFFTVPVLVGFDARDGFVDFIDQLACTVTRTSCAPKRENSCSITRASE